MKTSAFALSLLASALIAAPAMAQMPKLQPDDTYVSISGTVLAAEDDEFTLNYGNGQISVEMDDLGWQGNQPDLITGDEVTVYGRVEQHFSSMPQSRQTASSLTTRQPITTLRRAPI